MNEDAAKIRLGPRQNPQFVGSAALRVKLERQIVDRQTFKERRSAAMAEWQSLTSQISYSKPDRHRREATSRNTDSTLKFFIKAA